MRGLVPPLVPAPEFHRYHHPVLAAERVMHLGEGEVAVVVDLENPYRRGCRGMRRRGVRAPAHRRLSREARSGRARVHDDWPDNLAGISESRTGDAKTAFARADLIVEMELAYPRVAGMPIEGRGVLASYDGATGLLTVWLSPRCPSGCGRASRPCSAWRKSMYGSSRPDVGGCFGVKGHAYSEDILVPAVARRLGRPVKWIETRREHFLTAAADRDQAHHARLGVSRDGTIVALETEFTRDHGAHTTLGEAITYNTINHLVGPYRVPNYTAVGHNVVTHKTFIAAYRGAGRPEANFVLDRLLERAARGIGMDPAALVAGTSSASRTCRGGLASPTATAYPSPTTPVTT
jgi:carbon-monoxide dehydrogenase large subunit